MRSSVVVALVAAGAIAGGGVATYELTRAPEAVGVQFVTPASVQTPTTEPTTATSVPSATSSTTTRVASKTSTTHKSAVRTKEGTVTTKEQPAAATSESGPGRVVTDPPAPNDPIRSVAPPPVPGNKPSAASTTSP